MLKLKRVSERNTNEIISKIRKVKVRARERVRERVRERENRKM
jgi:hypothetical protein